MGQPANSPKNASAEKSGCGRGTFPPLSPVLDGVTDYLLHPGGLLPVHDTGTELVALGAWLRRQEEAAARRCACGKPCGSPSARTCGGAECIAALALAPIPSLAASPDIRGGAAIPRWRRWAPLDKTAGNNSTVAGAQAFKQPVVSQN